MNKERLKEILEQHKLWMESLGDEGDRANLSEADLYGANLSEADLRGANLSEADLRGVNLHGATNIPFIPMTCPDSGSFIGWKKASKHIVKLLIPEDARRSSSTGKKCRTDKAVVLAIENVNGGTSELMEVRSSYDSNFIYKIGEVVTVDNFDENRFNECAPGIHFFINRQEAVEY